MGDKHIHMFYLECFYKNISSGVWMPRWCSDVNNGLGMPIFLSYFPASYYIMLLFYPLHLYIGFSLLNILTVTLAVACLLSAISAYYCFKDIFPRNTAYICATLYIYFPYHAEITLYRFALAESWFFVILPLLIKYTRCMVLGKPKAKLVLILLFALGALTHFPTTIIAGLGIGLYLLIFNLEKKTWNTLFYYTLTFVAGLAIAAYQIAPASFFQMEAIQSVTLTLRKVPWPNRQIIPYDRFFLINLLYGILFSLVLLLWAGIIYRKYAKKNTSLDIETQAWAGVFILAYLLFTPLSIPFYNAFPILKHFFFPWRMQMLWVIFLIYLLGSILISLPPDKIKRFNNDLWALAVALIMVNMIQVYIINKSETFMAIVTHRELNGQREFYTKWIDKKHYDRKTIYSVPPSFFIPESGFSESTLISYDKVHQVKLRTICKSDECSVRLRLTYHPIWYISSATSPSITFAPKPPTGLSILTYPKGTHEVTLNVDSYNKNTPWWVRISPYISMVSLLAWMAAFFYTRKHAHSHQS
ncbi:MAG: hypothetical protein U1E36_01265 [Rickettsiales bacterium]